MFGTYKNLQCIGCHGDWKAGVGDVFTLRFSGLSVNLASLLDTASGMLKRAPLEGGDCRLSFVADGVSLERVGEVSVVVEPLDTIAKVTIQARFHGCRDLALADVIEVYGQRGTVTLSAPAVQTKMELDAVANQRG